MKDIQSLISHIHSLANPLRAQVSRRFFKTGKGDYGAEDIFLGLTMPQMRTLVHTYCAQIKKEEICSKSISSRKKKKDGIVSVIPELGGHSRAISGIQVNSLREASNTFSIHLEDIRHLLTDPHHEIRMAGVLILVHFAQKNIFPLPEIVEEYLVNKPGVNNWDLVDVSSEHIIGRYMSECLTHDERIAFIDDFIHSKNLWVNRIIIIASFYQIKKGNGKLTLYIAERMLAHQHDLIHKAVGWMLREVGKRCSMAELQVFLRKHAHEMPRTMLRYAIEHFEKHEREAWLTGKKKKEEICSKSISSRIKNKERIIF